MFRSKITTDVLESLRLNNVVDLDLSNLGLMDDDIVSLVSQLTQNISLVSLNLSGNQLTQDGAQQLAAFLKTNATLRTLNLSDNPIRNEGACAILEAITFTNTTLESLDLNGVSVNLMLSTDCTDVIKRMLENNLSGLTHLSFGGNHLSNAAMQQIAEGLNLNTRLKSLALPNCGHSSGVVLNLWRFAKSNSTLERLDLSRNDLNETACNLLVRILTSDEKKTGLNALVLDDNRLGDEPFGQLLKACLQSPNMQHLSLNGNPITAAGISKQGDVILEQSRLLTLSLERAPAITENQKNKIKATIAINNLLSPILQQFYSLKQLYRLDAHDSRLPPRPAAQLNEHCRDYLGTMKKLFEQMGAMPDQAVYEKKYTTITSAMKEHVELYISAAATQDPAIVLLAGIEHPIPFIMPMLLHFLSHPRFEDHELHRDFLLLFLSRLDASALHAPENQAMLKHALGMEASDKKEPHIYANLHDWISATERLGKNALTSNQGWLMLDSMVSSQEKNKAIYEILKYEDVFKLFAQKPALILGYEQGVLRAYIHHYLIIPFHLDSEADLINVTRERLFPNKPQLKAPVLKGVSLHQPSANAPIVKQGVNDTLRAMATGFYQKLYATLAYPLTNDHNEQLKTAIDFFTRLDTFISELDRDEPFSQTVELSFVKGKEAAGKTMLLQLKLIRENDYTELNDAAKALLQPLLDGNRQLTSELYTELRAEMMTAVLQMIQNITFMLNKPGAPVPGQPIPRVQPQGCVLS